MRIIAKLEVKDSYLVKGMQYEGLRKIGNINDFTKKYSQMGFHELMFSDVMASLYGRNRIEKIIGDFSKYSRIPIAAGGGISNQITASRLISNGADKVIINSSLFDNLTLLDNLANKYGEQAIIISVQARRVRGKSCWKVMRNAGRENTGHKLDEWLNIIKNMPFGELMICSIDKDGMLSGIDQDLLKLTRGIIMNHPIIYSGGVRSDNDLAQAKSLGADAVAIATALHTKDQHFSALNLNLIGKKGDKVKPIKTRRTISILNLNLGNIASLINCFEDIGYSVDVVEELDKIHQVERLILPGVGHFNQAIASISSKKLELKINEYIGLDRPLLGICLGMHVLGNKSEEDKTNRYSGLGFFSDNIYQLGANLNCNYRLPNVDWNKVDSFKGEKRISGQYYHIHKYGYTSVNEDEYDEYGLSYFYGQKFYSYLRKKNIIGFQFHPEKSGEAGKKAIIKSLEE